jgi:hypothetical protein
MKKKLLVVGLGLLLILTGSGPVAAQGGDACPALVEQALASLDDLCLGLDRNTACYGHNRVDALFWTPQPDTVFSRPADRVALIDLQRVATTPLDLDASEWGLALLHSRPACGDAARPGCHHAADGRRQPGNAVTPEDVAAVVTPGRGAHHHGGQRAQPADYQRQHRLQPAGGQPSEPDRAESGPRLYQVALEGAAPGFMPISSGSII